MLRSMAGGDVRSLRWDVELAQVWVEGRAGVLCAVERSFPAAGPVVVEAAVDRAWVELYEQSDAGSPERLWLVGGGWRIYAR